MQLIIDIGNTRVKTAVFKGVELLKETLFTKEDFENKPSIFDESFTQVGFAATGDTPEWLLNQGYTHLTNQSKLPFSSGYNTMDTVGIDRLANIAAVCENSTPTLVIDAGTCITYDIYTIENGYVGGAISPGVAMRLKALNNFTAKLPLLEQIEDYLYPAKTTKSSISAGVHRGVVGEIQLFMNDSLQKYPKLNVYLTGGDAFYFDKLLKNPIFVDTQLTLRGLNRILLENA